LHAGNLPCAAQAKEEEEKNALFLQNMAGTAEAQRSIWKKSMQSRPVLTDPR